MEEFKISGKKITNVEKAFLAEQGLKWCSKCKSARTISEFAKSSQTSDGLDGQCKSCNSKRRLDNIEIRKEKDRLYYEANRELKIQQAAEYRKNNPDKIVEIRSRYYESKKDIILQKNAEYRIENIDKVYTRQHEYHRENLVHRKAINKVWRSNNLEHSAEYIRNRYNNDLDFKMRKVCREIVRRAFLSANTKKSMSVNKALGYSPKDLISHIEKQFKPGMTWDNYGEWHIDHIVPISSAKSLAEGLYLSRLDNLQPLWADENLIKGNKILTNLENES